MNIQITAAALAAVLLFPLDASAQSAANPEAATASGEQTTDLAAPAAATDPAQAKTPAVVEDPSPEARTEDVHADEAEPTQDEVDADYALVYGHGGQQDGYNPVADPTLPTPANVGEIWDPWEKYNRRVHDFNRVVDGKIAKPLAQTYVKVVPRLMRLGVNNFFNNIRLPISAVNSLLQGHPGNAGRNIARFAINTTLGMGGLVDAAADANLYEKSEDFGQTMGTWGWQRSRYLELPFFGPRTVRDTLGMVVDAPLSPVRHVGNQNTRLGLQGLALIDVRAELLALDGLAEGIEDDYTLLRDTWSRRRIYQINSDRRKAEGEDQLPDYLQDDRNPQAPADAIPVIPKG